MENGLGTEGNNGCVATQVAPSPTSTDENVAENGENRLSKMEPLINNNEIDLDKQAQSQQRNNVDQREDQQQETIEAKKSTVKFSENISEFCDPPKAESLKAPTVSSIHAVIFDNVCHFRKQSFFTKMSENLQLDGFKNFLYLALIISCGRTFFENLSTYGVTTSSNPFRFLAYVAEYGFTRLAASYAAGLAAFAIGSLVLEKCYVAYLRGNQRATKLASGNSIFEITEKEENYFCAIYCTHLAALLAVPIAGNRIFPANFYFMVVVCYAYLALGLKLYSYHQTNSWWRTGIMYGQKLENMRNLKKLEDAMSKYLTDLQNENPAPSPTLPRKRRDLGVTAGASSPKSGSLRRSAPKAEIVYYPQNLSITDMAYYVVAPTMCYQANFPRTKRPRSGWFIARCAIEAFLILELQAVLLEQWIYVPLAKQKFMLRQLTFDQFVLKWTKLSLGSITIWLIGFYGMFQSLANLNAEILRFDDRDFYRDWWNAKTVGEFWRHWNIPVHRWCVRHLYKPLLIEGGYSSTAASFAVYLVSGLLHEYLISAPLDMLCVHFLIGMTLQQPFDIATANLHRTSPRLANSLIWLSLILGQSLLILLYYNDAMVRLRVAAAEAAASLII